MVYLRAFRKSCKFIGCWGEESFTNYHKLLMVALIYLDIGIVSYLCVCIGDAAVTASEKFQYTGYALTVLMLTVNYGALFMKRQSVKELFNVLESFDNFGIPKNIDKSARYLQMIGFFYIGYTGCACLMDELMYIIGYEECTEHSLNENDVVYCGFLLRSKYPYEISEGVLLYLHLVLEMFALTAMCLLGPHLQMAAIIAVELVVIRLDHLKELLRGIDGTKNPDKRWRKLRKCIIYHIHIIEYTLCDKISKCFKFGFMLLLLGSGSAIGCAAGALQKEYVVTPATIIIGFSTSLLLLSRSGQRLHDCSLSVGIVAYELDWLNADLRFRRAVLLIILRANKPLTFQTLYTGDFHFETFKKIMSTAYTIFSFKTGLGNQ